MDFIIRIFTDWGDVILSELINTLTMVGITLVFATIVGIPLGVLLVLTRKGGQAENNIISFILNTVINLFRSLPFIILTFMLYPLTRKLVGTTIGVRGIIFPLVCFTAPFVSRQTEAALLEVNAGVIEAFQSMGIPTSKIMWNIVVREARAGLVRGITITTISLVGATAMAGLVGAGGLGSVAYQYGFQRFEAEVMYGAIVVLIILVQTIQTIGNIISKKLVK